MTGGLSSLRVLLLDGAKQLRQVLAPIVNGAGIRELAYATSAKQAIELLAQTKPHLVFLDFDAEPKDALLLVQTVRKPNQPWNAQIPIIVLATQPTASDIRAARDAGINEIVIKPLTIAAVMDRLSRVILKPRAFVAGPTYRGPDRRRRSDPAYRGPGRRAVPGAPDLRH